MPSLQPDYRASRPHEEFVTNLKLPAAQVKAALAKEWNAVEELKNPPLEEIAKLAREKYETRAWNFKFPWRRVGRPPQIKLRTLRRSAETPLQPFRQRRLALP